MFWVLFLLKRVPQQEEKNQFHLPVVDLWINDQVLTSQTVRTEHSVSILSVCVSIKVEQLKIHHKFTFLEQILHGTNLGNSTGTSARRSLSCDLLPAASPNPVAAE